MWFDRDYITDNDFTFVWWQIPLDDSTSKDESRHLSKYAWNKKRKKREDKCFIVICYSFPLRSEAFFSQILLLLHLLSWLKLVGKEVSSCIFVYSFSCFDVICLDSSCEWQRHFLSHSLFFSNCNSIQYDSFNNSNWISNRRQKYNNHKMKGIEIYRNKSSLQLQYIENKMGNRIGITEITN